MRILRTHWKTQCTRYIAVCLLLGFIAGRATHLRFAIPKYLRIASLRSSVPLLAPSFDLSCATTRTNDDAQKENSLSCNRKPTV
ncbi:hypothetical protein J3E69DRAFT_336818 [Trichoderma sp. SZMC 28015]